MRKVKVKIPQAMYEALQEMGDPDEVVENAIRIRLNELNH